MNDEDTDKEPNPEWAARLAPYLDAQAAVRAMRDSRQPFRPWPSADNEMLAYLVSRAGELEREEDARGAILWVAVHAWFEGALHERNTIIGELSAA